MLVTRNLSQTLWEAMLPPEYQQLPPALAAADALLDDPSFFEPYKARFSQFFGRPSIPIETYLRMMFLKYRYRLGFESLCAEVADSISWTGSAGSAWAREMRAVPQITGSTVRRSGTERLLSRGTQHGHSYPVCEQIGGSRAR